MEEIPRPSAPVPEPPLLKASTDPALGRRIPALLFLAALFSGVAGGAAALPWHTVELGEERQSTAGYEFVEGEMQIIVGALCLALFAAAFAWKSPPMRRRLAGAGAVLAFGAALVPLELIARSAWAGQRNVLILGAGYVGWSWGLYLSLVSGFAAATAGSVAAAGLHRPARPAALKSRLPRRESRGTPPPAPGA